MMFIHHHEMRAMGDLRRHFRRRAESMRKEIRSSAETIGILLDESLGSLLILQQKTLARGINPIVAINEALRVTVVLIDAVDDEVSHVFGEPGYLEIEREQDHESEGGPHA